VKEALQALLTRGLPQPGVAAWGARLPDRAVASHCYSDWFAPQQVEQALTRLALAAESLKQHRIEPVRLCWVFEHARILLAVRGDGACLAFFVENRTGLPTAALERLLEEFTALPGAG
jgi:hypothetical protein